MGKRMTVTEVRGSFRDEGRDAEGSGPHSSRVGTGFGKFFAFFLARNTLGWTSCFKKTHHAFV